jgi:hypothetical protein
MICRANTDMKIMYCQIISILYVTKYCTKGESKTEILKKAERIFMKIPDTKTETVRGHIAKYIF